MIDILSIFDRREYTNCIACGRLAKTKEFFEHTGGIGICKNCNSHLPIIPVGSVFEEKSKYVDFCISAFYYRQPLRKLIIDYKFNSCTSYGKLFSSYMYLFISPLIDEGFVFDIIVPVPLSEERFKERGYNQAELLSGPLASALNITHCPDALTRIRTTSRQTDLTPFERQENVNNAFLGDKNKVFGKSVLLVDDVYTTGNTARECARELKEAGAEKVSVFTLARQPAARKSKEYYELLNK